MLEEGEKLEYGFNVDDDNETTRIPSGTKSIRSAAWWYEPNLGREEKELAEVRVRICRELHSRECITYGDPTRPADVLGAGWGDGVAAISIGSDFPNSPPVNTQFWTLDLLGVSVPESRDDHDPLKGQSSRRVWAVTLFEGAEVQ